MTLGSTPEHSRAGPEHFADITALDRHTWGGDEANPFIPDGRVSRCPLENKISLKSQISLIMT